MATTRLDRGQVVDTALRLLNEVGLEGLTLRRIAKELNVQAPALYWHFTNKQELLDEMATTIYRRMNDGEQRVADTWQQQLTDTCRLLRRTLLGLRDGAKVFSGTHFTDAGHAQTLEAQLRVFVDAGHPAGVAARAIFIAFTFTLGFVIEEQTVQPMPGERMPGYDVAKRAEFIGSEFPLAIEVGPDLFHDYGDRFEEGLRAIVAGVEATLLVRPEHRPPRDATESRHTPAS
ncbi:TetR/AcrR family transcriptional regulator C-terminal domain-containing protein [Streptomyces zagrosensis]|uniref:AcrR family transcriptional regulator n=1 Tax=Streptomyces zagrosensis TaxID=1042984 RepID=A0A7W9Q769_9ACTN|nr:TetR/AcrR family transcriptional regulator C-terminal domain-containing protein [Streptomyces zagrosensis]MBB5934825.1 AcrR family transcriptional regulator [Streptomyces zagrosensis]